MQELNSILSQFDIPNVPYESSCIETGLINNTFKLRAVDGGHSFLLQEINTNVFNEPECISHNVDVIHRYLKQHYPNYVFGYYIPTKAEGTLVRAHGKVWRMQPFFENTYSINTVSTASQAELTAREFAKFSSKLASLNSQTIKPAIPHFHNLELRWNQFLAAQKSAGKERLTCAENEITELHNYKHLIETYTDIVINGRLPLRIIHADTKINNILFDKTTHQPVCIIDYDTIMPGFFISDLGDMLRTMLCTGDENCTDENQMVLRKEFYHATVNGYRQGMEGIWSSLEDNYVNYAGKFMTYMQALRFITDYLHGDIYYKISYENQNLARAKNQLFLLHQLCCL